jgi:CheY-like chemotaxis protein
MNAPARPQPAPRGKVAVIDDDRLIRYLLDLHLRKAGYEVVTAEDAVAAGRVILEAKPDLVLCDVDMPFMDGYEFVTALRADPVTRHIPVIFLTVNKNLSERAKGLGAGHLVKPVMADELVRTVAKFVSPARQGAAE